MSNLTGLVLQGGGARGAFECGAISRLYRDPDFGIHAVAGASIGAINAACLVGGRSQTELGLSQVSACPPLDGTAPWAVEELWRRLKMPFMSFVPPMLHELAQKSGNKLCSPRFDLFDIFSWTNTYTTDRMRELLKELINFEKLNASPVRVSLVAVDVRSGKPIDFTNWGDQKGLTVEHIMASASLPPGFPMTEIDHHRYWDGGLFDNTPMESVIDALVEEDTRSPAPPAPKLPENDDESDLLVYLLQLMPGAGEVPEDMYQVCDRQMQIMFANKSQEDSDRVEQINEYVKLVRKLVKALPHSTARQFQAEPLLAKHHLVNLQPIRMSPGGIFSGADDFSVSTIDARIAEGFDAADQVVKAIKRRKSGASRAAVPKAKNNGAPVEEELART